MGVDGDWRPGGWEEVRWLLLSLFVWTNTKNVSKEIRQRGAGACCCYLLLSLVVYLGTARSHSHLSCQSQREGKQDLELEG